MRDANDVLEKTLRKLVFAALVASVTAIPCTVSAADKAPAGKAPAQGQASEAPQAFLSVNGVAIPEIEARIAIADRRAAGVADSPALQNAVRNQLVARELFAQQARSQGLDKDKMLSARLRMAREELLARAYEQDYLAKHPPTDDQVRKEYDSIKSRSGNKEFHLRQVVLETEDEAKGVITRLRGGESLQSLATLSRDEGSRARGGDLGWLTQGNLQPQFAEVVLKLGKGQYTQQPVKGPAGWHVILVEEQRPFAMPPYDEKIQARLRQELARQALAARLAEMMKTAKVE